MVITMSMHPSGPETLAHASHGRGVALARGVHALAMAAVPVLAFGFARLGVRLRGSGALSGLALAAQLTALVAVLFAGAMSGLVATAVVERMASAGVDANSTGVLQPLLWYTALLNQAFAAIYVVGSGAAMIGWSVVLWRAAVRHSAVRHSAVRHSAGAASDGLLRSIAVLGVVTGGGLVVARLGFVGHLDVRIFGLIVAAQALWQGLLAWRLWRR
ncbi:MAG TPA: hypothetical protein DGD08_10760 [Gemmatimonas aurantiaca]|uniref:Uncharacterized protein n=2 Tax=Gemmatimonas aurantiaca TaxID=173480 RepID=A0A3D4V948_9BACT|nr:hypothetical protein [Gemmatimonas aurantiaca]